MTTAMAFFEASPLFPASIAESIQRVSDLTEELETALLNGETLEASASLQIAAAELERQAQQLEILLLRLRASESDASEQRAA